MSDPSMTLFVAAQDLLGFCAAALGASVPERQYVSVPLVASDAEQLTVHSEGLVIYPVPGELEHELRPSIPVHTFTAKILRSWPMMDSDGTPPPPAIYQEASALIYSDGWLLENALRRGIEQRAIFSAIGAFNTVHLTGMIPQADEAGLAGWAFTLSVAIDGYDPADA